VPHPAELRAAVDLAVDNVHDIIIMVGAGLLITYVSPSVRRFGYEPDDLIGQSMSTFIHPEDAVRAASNFAAYQRGEALPDFRGRRSRYRRADGGWVWMEGSPTILRDADGAIIGLVNTLRDVSEHLEYGDLFETAFRYAATGMVLVRPNGQILRVNAAFCRMTGYDEAALLSTTVHAISDHPSSPADPDELQRLISGEIDSYMFNDRYRCAGGGALEVAVSLSIVRESDGSPKYCIGQIQDLSQQRAAESAQRATHERYRLIVENTSDMIVLSALDGSIQYVSTAVVATGHDSAQVVGASSDQNVHPDDLPAVREAFAGLLRGEPPQRVRWRGSQRDKEGWVWLESSPNLLRDPVTGEPTGFLDVARDVTEQVAQEMALQSARAAAEAAAEAKTQFLANMSHEIRTPLTAILGFANLLRETPDLGEAAAIYTQRIGSAGSALLAIVNDILDHAKLEAGKIELRPRPTDVAALLRETLDLFDQQAGAKNIDLKLRHDPEGPLAVLVDPDRVRQILINLVGNAVKFTTEGGVELQLEVLARSDMLRFTVRDTGPGLHEAQRTQLFQRFSQVDGSSTRQHGGTGLGLAICRGLVEAMGGEIGVDSVPGKGSAFWFTLSAPQARLLDDTAPEAGLVTLDGVRVLVVDDNPSNRELTSEVLAMLGAEVMMAADGREALALLALAPVDVALIDLHLPDMDGFAVLAELRATPGPNQDIPALAFTAADAANHDPSGFDGVVGKPFTISLIATSITAALEAPAIANPNARSARRG
jgi:PAS domain S-box-containing protein